MRSFLTPARRPFFVLALIPVLLLQAQVVAATGELIVGTTGGSLKGATRALGGAEFFRRVEARNQLGFYSQRLYVAPRNRLFVAAFGRFASVLRD